MKKYFKYIILLLLLTIGERGYSQEWNLILEMVVTHDGKPTAGAEVSLYRDGSFVKKKYSNGEGRVDLTLEPNGIYTIDVGGSENFIKKKVEVNTNNVPTEAITQDTYFPAEVDIFKKIEGLNYDVLNDPIGKIAYDKSVENFEVDKAYTAMMQNRLRDLEENYLAKKEEIEDQYDDAIKAADKAFKNEDWELAKEKYTAATKLKPNETYPSFQLAELKSKMIEKNKTDQQYDKAIASADQALAAKDYKTAIADYKRASEYKPDEDYPQNKIDEVRDLLVKQAKIDQDYLAAIEEGDNALKVSEYETAKAAFEKATALKPEEQYPKNKLSELNDILAQREAKEKEYQTAITNADKALEDKDFDAAKAAYQKAQNLKPTEKYPVEQIAKVEGLMAEAAKKDQEYLAAVEQGEGALQEKNYEAAIKSFEAAQSIKPSEEYPKNKIKEINDFIAKQDAKEDQYAEKIKIADDAFSNKSYEEAKAAYQEAAKIKPSESYPIDQIAKVEKALKEIEQKEENYAAAIKKGDEALNAENYEAAKTAYQEALTIKAEEQYPKDKLSEIKTIVVNIQKNEEAYKEAIAKADEALAEKDYEIAKEYYQSASAQKENEQYPKDKIAEIEETLAKMAETEKAYTAAIEKGDLAKGENKLEEAKAAYKEALAVKSDASYPQKQIEEIDKVLEERKLAEENYQKAIQTADEALANKSYQTAIDAYKNALAIKANESYPKEKIKEIEGLLAKVEAKDQNYKAAIEQGDKAFEEKEWETAKTAYEEALSIKDEEYPKTKIEEVNTKLTEIAAQKEKAAQIEADYQKAISEGDQKLQENELEKALAAFNKASELKAEESYPKEKIAQIEKELEKIAAEKAEKEKLEKIEAEYKELIAKADEQKKADNLKEARKNYQAALAIKTDESYPQSQIEEINGILADTKEQDAAYQEAIDAGDQLYSEEKWEAAKEKFSTAASIKSDEQYPKDQLAAIEEKLAEIAAKNEQLKRENEKQAELDEQYGEAVAAADEAFKNENFKDAEKLYQEALTIKDESYPKEQLTKIDNKLAAIKDKKEAAAAKEEQAKIDAAYQGLVAEADQLLEEGSLEKAKEKYRSALEVKDESYPKEKITDIDNELDALAAKEKEAAKAAKAAEKQAKFDQLIAEGDALLADQKLKAAKEKYVSALGIKEDAYPAKKIAKIDELIATIAAANAKKEQQQQLKEDYQTAIASADEQFDKKNYNEAIASYQKALNLKPEESYPKQQIQESEALLAAKEKEAAKEDAKYQELIAAADQSLSEDKLTSAKNKYEEALALKPSESYPANKIAEIEETLAQQAQNAEQRQLEKEKEAQKEADYQAAIVNADQLFSEKKFSEAMEAYETANAIKPNESYPQTQIEKINGILAKLAEKKEQREATKAAEAQYEELIAAGDNAMQAKQYRLAKREYNDAIALQPKESYPKKQLEKVNAILDKMKEEKLAEKQKEEEPIQIQKGPRSTIDKSAEEKLDELYEEKWAERKEEKKEFIKSREETVHNLKDQQREEEFKKRQQAHERIEGIAISLQKQNETADAYNMQNYETVLEKEKAIEENRVKKEREAEKKRNNVFDEKQDIQDAQESRREAYQKENEIRNEFVEDLREEVKENTEKRKKGQQERIGISKTKVEEKAEAIHEYTVERRSEHRESTTANLNEAEENYKEARDGYQSASRKRIAANNNDVEQKREAIHDFEQEQQKLNGENYDALKEKEENYAEFNEEKRSESQKRIAINQEENEQLLEKIENESEEKGKSYKKGQKNIVETEEALEKRRNNLNKSAEKRRQENADKEYYRGSDQPREDPSAADYPQGVTEKVIEGENSTTIRRVVVNGTEVDIYEKTLTNYGEVFYTKNGTNITEEVWDKESIE